MLDSGQWKKRRPQFHFSSQKLHNGEKTQIITYFEMASCIFRRCHWRIRCSVHWSQHFSDWSTIQFRMTCHCIHSSSGTSFTRGYHIGQVISTSASGTFAIFDPKNKNKYKYKFFFFFFFKYIFCIFRVYIYFRALHIIIILKSSFFFSFSFFFWFAQSRKLDFSSQRVEWMVHQKMLCKVISI